MAGLRGFSTKRSFTSKFKASPKRAIKRAANPMYGKKGMGYINNPKKAVYNKIYNATTIDVRKSGSSRNSNVNNSEDDTFWLKKADTILDWLNIFKLAKKEKIKYSTAGIVISNIYIANAFIKVFLFFISLFTVWGFPPILLFWLATYPTGWVIYIIFMFIRSKNRKEIIKWQNQQNNSPTIDDSKS